MAASDRLRRSHAGPFRPFHIHVSDGTRLDVTDPRMVVGESAAVVHTAWAEDGQGRRLAKHWRTVAHTRVVGISEIDGPARGRKQRRRPK